MQRARYVKRIAGLKNSPLHISRKILAERREYFDGIIDTLCAEMQEVAREKPEIPSASVEMTDFRILSFNGDRMGKVFLKDGSICRGIYAESCTDFKNLWETGLLQVLGRHGMIPKTEISDYYLPEYPVILTHESVQIIPSKLWCHQMIKDASILISVIKRCAERVGYTLHDGHLNNVSFHNGKPVFTDIGSIVKNNGQRTVCNKEILFSGLYRLVFQEIGNSILSRIQPYDEENNAIWLMPRYYDDLTREYHTALGAYRRFHRFHSRGLTNSIISSLFDSYDVRPEYIDLLFPEPQRTITEAEQTHSRDISEVIGFLEEKKLSFDSFVDVGGNHGRLSAQINKQFGVYAASLEHDDAAANQSYIMFKREDICGNVLAFNYLYGCDSVSRSIIKADMAAAIDITNHVNSFQQYRFDSLINSLCKCSNQYVLITFYPYRKEKEKYIDMIREPEGEVIDAYLEVFKRFAKPLECRRIHAGEDAKNQGYLIFGEIMNGE